MARIIIGNQLGDIDAQTRRRLQVDRSRQFIWYAGSNLSGQWREVMNWRKGQRGGGQRASSYLARDHFSFWSKLVQQDVLDYTEYFNSIYFYWTQVQIQLREIECVMLLVTIHDNSCLDKNYRVSWREINILVYFPRLIRWNAASNTFLVRNSCCHENCRFGTDDENWG